MHRKEYREVYLHSPHWQAVRAAALDYAGRRCQVCNSPRALDVHHRTYERLGRELPADVTVLCRACHERHHEAMASGPRDEQPPKPRAARPKLGKRAAKRQRQRERQREVAPGALARSLAEMKERNAA